MAPAQRRPASSRLGSPPGPRRAPGLGSSTGAFFTSKPAFARGCCPKRDCRSDATCPYAVSHDRAKSADRSRAAGRARLPGGGRHRRGRRLDGRGVARRSWPTWPTTAGAEVVGAEWQNRRHVDPNWYVGKGKAEELAPGQARDRASRCSSRTTSCQPNQQKALESLLGVKVLDRSGLILDIFAQHARTHEGRLQVELAQLEYQLPRLTRLWTHLSRTQGGIGSRGPGETPARDGPADHPRQDQEAEGARRARAPAARDGGALAATGGWCRRWRSSATRTPASRSMLNALVGHEAALCRGQAVRHARSDEPHGQAGRRPDRGRDGHGGLHPQAAAPARRRVPRDARRGEPRRRAARGRRRGRHARARAPRDRAAGAGRAGRRRKAAPARLQQGGSRRSGGDRRRRCPRPRSPGRCSSRR